MKLDLPPDLYDVWPALRLVLEGHATLGDVCGEAPTLDDLQLLDMAAAIHNDAMRRHEKRNNR